MGSLSRDIIQHILWDAYLGILYNVVHTQPRVYVKSKVDMHIAALLELPQIRYVLQINRKTQTHTKESLNTWEEEREGRRRKGGRRRKRKNDHYSTIDSMKIHEYMIFFVMF